MVAIRTSKRASSLTLFALLFVLAPQALAQTEQTPAIDVTHYKINAELLPHSSLIGSV